MKLSWGFFKLFNLFPALKDINWCLIFGITPSQVLNFFQNLPSLKIGAYRLVLIKQNACTINWKISQFITLLEMNKCIDAIQLVLEYKITYSKIGSPVIFSLIMQRQKISKCISRVIFMNNSWSAKFKLAFRRP